MNGVVVLVDDIRSFRDGRPCHVARTANAAVALLNELAPTIIDELWLDYDLGAGKSVMPVVDHLVAAARSGFPLRVRRVIIHSSNLVGARQVLAALRDAGYSVERNYNRATWTW